MKFDFSKKEFDYFVEQCGFTDQEVEVLIYKRRDLTIFEISCRLNISNSTVSRRIKSIKKKIVKVINETS